MVILVIGFILENNIPNESELLVSDLNEDNLINVLDIMLILDIIFEG